MTRYARSGSIAALQNSQVSPSCADPKEARVKFVSKAPATFALAVLLAGSALLSFVPTASATVIVPSTADIFLAGQSSVPANVNTGYAADAATNYNPGAAGLGLGTLPISISVFGGETLI